MRIPSQLYPDYRPKPSCLLQKKQIRLKNEAQVYFGGESNAYRPLAAALAKRLKPLAANLKFGPFAHIVLRGNHSNYCPTPKHATELLTFVNKGLQYVKRGQYEQAAKHFATSELAEKTGIGLNIIPVQYLHEIPDSAHGLRKAWFHPYRNGFGVDHGRVHFFPLIFEQKPKTSKQRAMLQATHYRNAMIGLEEWIHAIQYNFDILTSKAFCHLALPKDSMMSESAAEQIQEHDIAQFFVENNVPVDTEFLDRYERRNHIIGTPKKRYFPDTDPPRSHYHDYLTQNFRMMKPGEIKTVGSNSDIQIRGQDKYIQDGPCFSLKKNADGTFEISPLEHNKVHFYFCRGLEYWHNDWTGLKENFPPTTLRSRDHIMFSDATGKNIIACEIP